ncbi:PD-(D/E)XK motif protein [Rhizobium laguerreae]|uniref:PD-(D/E)XK motif protein n=1 Tax=Rhizobium laguerreae TaxID=1076926 RepID=A0A7Y2R8H1_9HYPH|nr:PD-(D/E)XK motif protein [Rhizobium laguerreae]NNH66342.1 PD-(D/E)XK motif protein [Rhizobium laguerreae]
MLDEWDQIVPASEPGACNVRLADARHPLDFKIGKNFRSKYVFQIDALCTPELKKSVPKLTGIDCTFEPIANDRFRLSITLGDPADFRNFRLMCMGLMLATDNLSPLQSDRGMIVVLDELRRWQDMLRQRRERLLARTEIIGLVGELLFLRDVLVPRFGILSALRCWIGHEGHEQDFTVGGTIFEVKTQIVTADRRIRISSEDQLDPVQGRIFICNQGIAPLPTTDSASDTLNRLAGDIRNLATDYGHSTVDLFEIALLNARYEWKDEYDEEAWILVDRSLYAVTGDFPRIERNDLRAGVELVTYSIRVADCEQYRVNLEETISETAA